MKRFKTIIIIISGLLFTFSSCEEQILDKSPRDSFSDVDIWGNLENTKMFVWNLYANIGGMGAHGGTTRRLTDGASDINFGLHHARFAAFGQGELTPDNTAGFGDVWNWQYDNIRKANMFLERIDEVPGSAEEKNRLKGEVKYMRARAYWWLTSLFGGVPLLTETFSLDDDYMAVSRASYQDCVDFIVKDLDDAAALLPLEIPAAQFGRATRGAALALKSRVLLYAASKLYDPSTEPSGPLFDYNKPGKWQDASDAAKAVIDLNLYSLEEVNDAAEYQEMLTRVNSELIFARATSTIHSGTWANFDKVNSPNGYHDGWSDQNPTNHFSDMFQMKDGLSIHESPLYDDSAEGMYQNREIRFYANLIFNGAMYRGRPAQFYIPGGLDSPQGPGSHNASWTGYCQRKFMDESYDFTTSFPTTPVVFARLSEIYLNYAEAQYHLGHEDVAREYVNKIRNRVHLPDIEYTGERLLEAIMHERTIELCWENHRFFDMRRWMIAEEVMNIDAQGKQWRYENEQGELDINGTLTYRVVTAMERNFHAPRMYHIPIPRSEIERSSLQQNPGYN